MTDGQKKFLLIFAGLLAVWRIVHVPGFAEGFWNFFAMGITPWDNRMLAPNTMIRIALIIFAVTVFMVFRKEFFAAIPARKSRPVKKAAPVALKPPKAKKDWSPQVDFVRKHSGAMRQRTVAVWRASGRLIARVTQSCWRAMNQGARNLYRIGRVAIIFLVAIAIIAWRWIEPHIRTFDQWLNLRLHQNPTTAEILRIGEFSLRLFSDSFAKASDYTRRILK